MKKRISLFSAGIFLAVSLQAHAQSFIYDQQTTNAPSVSGDYFNIQEDSPLLQSFIPSLSAIGFAQFQFWDISNNGTNGATVYINLWTGSPNISLATFLGSTTPVYMSNGFGSSVASVTNFYFSSLTVLTAGQTYYLQPVVLSGDNPFDIKVNNDFPHEDYYANGSLFEKGTDVGIDLWFREGVVVPVPEPTILVLVSLSGILAFSFKRHSKSFIVLLFTASILSVHAGGDSVVQATADEAGLSSVSAMTLSPIGTFWVITTNPNGRLTELPYPFLPPDLSAMPIYSVTNNIFIVDNTGGQITSSFVGRMSSAQAASTARAQAESMTDFIDLMETKSQSFRNNLYRGTLNESEIFSRISIVAEHSPRSIRPI